MGNAFNFLMRIGRKSVKFNLFNHGSVSERMFKHKYLHLCRILKFIRNDLLVFACRHMYEVFNREIQVVVLFAFLHPIIRTKALES